jgi:quinol-cytochrome oxidoreductase complex cytochrome b subunit
MYLMALNSSSTCLTMEERRLCTFLLMQSPPSIVPEWYLLPCYANLRSFTNGLLGVIGMLSSLTILLPMPGLDASISNARTPAPTSNAIRILVSCH